RQRIADEMRDQIRLQSSNLRLGITVLSVVILEARPPDEVSPDFALAQAARSHKEQRIIESRTACDRIEQEAKSRSTEIRDSARAAAARVLAEAEGQASRFRALADEASQHRELTLSRLYFEAMTSLFSHSRRKVVIQSDQPIDLNVLGR